MRFQYCAIWFVIWAAATLVVSVSSSSINVNYNRVQGCSLVGIELQNCLLVPNPKAVDSCCTILNQAIKAGYYCLCSLLSLSNNNYPVITDEIIALSFSNCYLSLPPLTHCHVSERPPRAIGTAPPVDALPWINHHLPPPLPPVLVPPELPRGGGPLVPNLPPKVNENRPPLNNLNSSIVGSSRSMPKLSIQHERSDHVTSDGADVVKMLLHSRNLMMAILIAVLCVYYIA